MPALKFHGDGDTVQIADRPQLNVAMCDGCGAVVLFKLGPLSADGWDVHVQWHKDLDAKLARAQAQSRSPYLY